MVMTMAIEQGGQRFYLAADETNRRTGRNANLDDLNLRHVPVQTPERKIVARLWPADLADLLRLLQDTPGYSNTTTPIPDQALEDPRKALLPTWKMAAGVSVVLFVALVAAIMVLRYLGFN